MILRHLFVSLIVDKINSSYISRTGSFVVVLMTAQYWAMSSHLSPVHTAQSSVSTAGLAR
jgi:hypothetical protein